MRKVHIITFMVFLFCGHAFANEAQVVKIAVSQFSPPFAYQTADNELSGFDIDLMVQICKMKNLNCKFIPMESKYILEAIISKNVDVGIGGIDISLTSLQYLDVSVPYMKSEYRFLTTKKPLSTNLDKEMLTNKKIGVNNNGLAKKEFSSYAKQQKSKIIEFQDNDSLIAALVKGSIDLALLRNETAIYWQNHSSGRIYALGEPLHLGDGIGIPISLRRPNLVKTINTAILQYKVTPEYKSLYSMYFDPF